MDVKILGQIIGKCTGWDQVDDWVICLCDFVPSSAYLDSLSDGRRFQVNFIEGTFHLFDDDNDCLLSGNIIQILSRAIAEGWLFS